MSSPAISVCMPVYNGARFLSSAFACIAAQTFKDFEVIVIDDGSTDESAAVAERLLHQHALRGSVRQTPNQGAERARFVAFDSATADVLAALDCDDSWHPTYLERMLGALNRFPEVAMVYCDMRQESEDGSVVLKSHIAPWIDLSQAKAHGDLYVFAPRTFFRLSLGGIVTLPSCTLCRRALYVRSGPLPGDLANLRNALDWFFSLRLARCAAVAFINEPLVRHPIYAGSTSGNLVRLTQCNVQVIRWMLHNGKLDRVERSIARRKGARICTWACDITLRREMKHWAAARWALTSLRFRFNLVALKLLALTPVPRTLVDYIRRPRRAA